MLGIAFSIRAILIAALIASASGFAGGFWVRDKFCDAAKVRAELAILKADLEAATKAADDATRLAKDLDTQAANERKKVKDYERVLASRKAAACRLTDDDVRRLR
jgi:hypothetical protein